MRKRWLPLLAVGALLLAQRRLRADGFFAPRREYLGRSAAMVASPRQEALLVFDGSTVTVTLRTHFRAGPDELAWLVPVPGDPVDIRQGDDAVFEELEAETAPRFLRYSGGGLGCGCGARGPEEISSAVIVERSGTAGIFGWTVLSATDAAALAKWLSDNGYVVPAGAERVLASYVKGGWKWLAMKVRAELAREPLLAPHPIVYSYRADRLVYPLAISQLSADLENEVVLYVLAEWRYECDNWSNRSSYALGSSRDARLSADAASPSGTNYEQLFRRATDAENSHLFVTEYSQDMNHVSGRAFLEKLGGPDPLRRSGDEPRTFWLTRLRAVMTPKAMDRDVVLRSRRTDFEDESRMRSIPVGATSQESPGQAAPRAAAGFGALALGLVLFRRPGRVGRACGAAALILATLIVASL